jgi:hypothetical protein
LRWPGKEIKEASSHIGGIRGGIGSFAEVGIFPIRDPEIVGPFNPNIKTPFDIYGAHFDFTLGNYPGSYITSGGFRADSNFEWYSPEFGTAIGIGPDDIPKDFVDY